MSNPRPCECGRPESAHRSYEPYRPVRRDQPLRPERSNHYLHERLEGPPLVTRREVERMIHDTVERLIATGRRQ